MSRFIFPALLASLALAQGCEYSPTGSSEPVASVEVSPAAPQVTVGDSVKLIATLRDRWRRVLKGRSVTWSTEPTVSLAVSPNGVVTGYVPGIAVVTATSEGKQGSVSVVVKAQSAPGSTNNFEASATGAVTARFTGKAVFGAASDQYGNPRFVLIMVNGPGGGIPPGTSYRLHLSRLGSTRPGTDEFAIEPISEAGGHWIAGYQVMDGDGAETAYFAAVSGTLRITASSSERLAGEFEFEARSSRYGLPPLQVMVRGSFDAGLAN
ncbi:MAG: Ig-like domain-containing protein [Gemmatimonadaceae bacterium]|nr:Ig-like domain-containing protein [Gemmatimonadaceae bacterium]